MDRTGGGRVRRIGWVLGVVFATACGGSASNGSRVSSASTSIQECTTSTAAPVPLSDLKYDARPNPPVNLLQNGDVEAGSGTTPAAWRVDVSPAGSTLTWDTGRVLSGTHALLVTTTMAGRAAWAQDVGTVEAGLRYRLRANVFASTADPGTHALEILWVDGSGKQIGRDALQSSTAGQWFEVDGLVTAPSTAAKATVAVSALSPGQYSFDDVILVTAAPEPIAIAGGFPLGFWGVPRPGAVKNADFVKQGAPGQPLAWQRSLASGNAVLSWNGDGQTSPASIEIDVATAGDASWVQNIDVDPGIQYSLVATIYASSVAAGSHAIELTWRDTTGAPLAKQMTASQASGTWSDVSQPALQVPAGAVTATIAFRAMAPGTYRVRYANLVAAPAGGRIFDPHTAGFVFSVDNRSDLPQAIYIDAPEATINVSDPTAVLKAANSSATAMWMGGDEIAWQPSPISPQSVIANYQAVKALGGTAARLPVWINHAPRGTRAQPYDYSTLLPYSAGADVLSMDVYPIPAIGHAQLPNEGPWSVGQYVDILRSAAATWGGAQRKPLWMVLQGFDWWEYDDTLGGDHAVAVEWRDAGGTLLRSDAIGADRSNAWRDVMLDGLVPPSGSVSAVVKVAAYKAGAFEFDRVALSEQGGSPIVASGGPTEFALDAARGEVVIGSAQVQASRRYTLGARVLAQTRPTQDETRFMAWDAIIHGARGLSWWGFDYTFEGDAFLDEIANVTNEMKALSADLLAPISMRSLRASDSSIEGIVLDGQNGLLLALANRTRSPVTATIHVDGPSLSSITRVGEACAIAIDANELRETFAPLGVHLYRLH